MFSFFYFISLIDLETISLILSDFNSYWVLFTIPFIVRELIFIFEPIIILFLIYQLIVGNRILSRKKFKNLLLTYLFIYLFSKLIIDIINFSNGFYEFSLENFLWYIRRFLFAMIYFNINKIQDLKLTVKDKYRFLNVLLVFIYLFKFITFDSWIVLARDVVLILISAYLISKMNIISNPDLSLKASSSPNSYKNLAGVNNQPNDLKIEVLMETAVRGKLETNIDNKISNSEIKSSYGKEVLTRIQFRFLNTISFIIPPVGVVLFFYYKNDNNIQSGIFLFWSVLGALVYLGLI